MTQRINPYSHFDLVKPLIEHGTVVTQSGLEKKLMELVKIRASQINGCAVCLQMHTRDARKHGDELRHLENLPLH